LPRSDSQRKLASCLQLHVILLGRHKDAGISAADIAMKMTSLNTPISSTFRVDFFQSFGY
jgi:hypothetical protein